MEKANKKMSIPKKHSLYDRNVEGMSAVAALANYKSRVNLCVKMTSMNGIPEHPSKHLSGFKKLIKVLLKM